MYLPALTGNGIRSGLMIFIFRQFFKGLPKELEDAAYLDGCGPLRTFVQIMIPNALSSFLTVFLFSVVWYWNDYYVSSTFFTSNTTIALMLKNLGTQLNNTILKDMGGAARIQRADCLDGSRLSYFDTAYTDYVCVFAEIFYRGYRTIRSRRINFIGAWLTMLLFFLSLFIFYSFMKIYSAVLNFSLNYVILFQYHNINSYLFRLIERNALIMTKEKSDRFTGHRPEKRPDTGK